MQVICFVGPLHFSFWRIPNERGKLTSGERCSSSIGENCKTGWVLYETVLTCFLCPFSSPSLPQSFLSRVHSWVWNKETLVPRMVWSKGRGLALLKWEGLSWTKGVVIIFIMWVKTWRIQKSVQHSAELRAHNTEQGGDFTPIYSSLFLGYSISLLSHSGPGVHLQINRFVLPDLTWQTFLVSFLLF